MAFHTDNYVSFSLFSSFFTDQTCDKGTSCVFSKRITLDTYVDMCQVLFSISPAEVSKRVLFTNAYYGGRRPRGTRIIFVNGEGHSFIQ